MPNTNPLNSSTIGVPMGASPTPSIISGQWKAFLVSLYPDSHNVIGPVYDAILGAIGAALDQYDPYQIGLAQEFSVTTATGDALDRCGADWGVARHSGEADSAYRVRILSMLPIYANGASDYGLSAVVTVFTGTAPVLIDCAGEGWVWTESAWLDDAWTDPIGRYAVYIFVQNPGAVAYSHYDMEFAVRRGMPARSRAIIWHNGADTSPLAEASDAIVTIVG